MNNQNGFTLIELMIALVLGLLIVAASIQVFVNANQSLAFQQSNANIQNSGLFGMDYIIRDLRRANIDSNSAAMTVDTLHGGVVFNNTNSQELVGKTLFIENSIDAYYSNHMTRIKINDELNPNYLWIILNFYQQKKIFFNLCTNWNNQSGVGLELLKNLKIINLILFIGLLLIKPHKEKPSLANAVALVFSGNDLNKLLYSSFNKKEYIKRISLYIIHL